MGASQRYQGCLLDAKVQAFANVVDCISVRKTLVGQLLPAFGPAVTALPFIVSSRSVRGKAKKTKFAYSMKIIPLYSFFLAFASRSCSIDLFLSHVAYSDDKYELLEACYFTCT